MIWEIDEATPVIEGIDGSGRPIPSYAASLGLIPAPFGRRAAATAIEVAIVLVLLLPLLIVALPAAIGLAASSDPAQALADTSGLLLVVVCGIASSVLATAFIVVQMVLHGRRGVTVGKALMGIRSINVRTLERPGFWRGEVVRYLVMWASFIVPLIGPLLVIALSPLFDPQRRGRGWPDLAGATWFVDVRRGLDPYDAKRMRIARKTVATNLQDQRPALPSLATSATAEATGAYIPVARSSGGVLGAHRVEQPVAAAVSAAGTTAGAAPADERPAWHRFLLDAGSHDVLDERRPGTRGRDPAGRRRRVRADLRGARGAGGTPDRRGHPPRQRRDGRRRGRRPSHRTIACRCAGRTRHGSARARG